MSNLVIRKVAVLGAGVMGAQIAAHLINAKVPVMLFDLAAKEGDANGIVNKALAGLKKLSPAPFGNAAHGAFIQAANYETDLAKLGECDLVIEAIAERMDWKHALYAKVAPHLAPHAIFASNTSGLSITELSNGFSDELKKRFCGVHFFNPPRYMHLVELIPTATTDAQTLDDLETFATTTLGKGVVRAKDTPNFIANRVGVFSILAVMAEAEKFGLSFDVVDDLTGAKLGRAKSATFRTADVVGLDTMAHVIKTMDDNLKDDPFASVYPVPTVLKGLVEKGALGQKSGAGFYKKEGKEIKVLNPATGEYVTGGGTADEIIARILKRPAAERLKLLRETDHPQAQFLWAIFRDVFHYIALHLESIADNARDIDFAIRWGFGWNEGPFETWQAAGWKQVADWVSEDIAAGKALSTAPLPTWVAEVDGAHSAAGSYSPANKGFTPRSALAVYARQAFPASLVGEQAADPKTAGVTVFEDDSIRLWHQNDGILIASFKSKMNTVGPGVLAGLQQAVALAEQDFKGLVIWQTGSLSGGPFSAGADLQAAMPLFMKGGAAAVEPFVAEFQNTAMRIKYAQVPVVAAMAGLALGGGCEIPMHCAARVAHLETYIGLVELGVGLVPAGGGLKEAALRAAQAGGAYGFTNLTEFIKPWFQNVAMAKVSKSARDAQSLGFLAETDTVVFNIHELLHVAKGQAVALADAGYRPPLAAANISAAGPSVQATLQSIIANMRDGGFISAYDGELATRVANILTAGGVEAGTPVDEAWLLKLERKNFLEALSHPKTQERIMGMLSTGKPVRN
ncbi:putative 3-hydroxyacyl-CoA dehydrogenase [Ephemeroptericola cinctiostellae]|uniref:Putative 3-hydroxyacyl-CoA dehydrogenase n=1 Tax=Ephemeroptericola cinctiostellae TaxID=2268024 RepID=A0A345D8G9_9BURK|nr:3-hydroxyacyl-CoA dehydrogenase/enoyl-CoA hydratase family protein [Ephemeroptericola cinctiostellae]AXF84657.1 putative 3-hydroxyacyl-CoA dehydrogenase [Ephemeroptericola cinctiostellae]